MADTVADAITELEAAKQLIVDVQADVNGVAATMPNDGKVKKQASKINEQLSKATKSLDKAIDILENVPGGPEATPV
jgi:hypothetical protein